MVRVIAIANQKGGCGKTTTTINLGACLARLNRRVLLLDMDPQAHTTVGLGILPEKLERTAYDLLCPDGRGRPAWDDAVIKINSFLDLLPGDLRLHQFEEAFSQQTHRTKQLKYLLLFSLPRPVPYDFILIDCPPNLGLLTLNALEAAREVIIPVEPSFFSLHGLAKISETLQQVGSQRGSVHQTHALLTLYHPQSKFSQEVLGEVKMHFQDRLFHSIIHDNVALREAAGAGLSIADFDPQSLAYRDYMSLASEILERRCQLERGEDASQSSRHLLAPRRVSGGVLFQCLAPGAREVFLAGDFNQWVAQAMFRRLGSDLWQRIVPLVGGRHRYKFLIDGEWNLDPNAPAQKENFYGKKDSYIELDAH